MKNVWERTTGMMPQGHLMTVASSRGSYFLRNANFAEALLHDVSVADRVVADSTVGRLHPRLSEAVKKDQLLTVDANEKTKTFQNLEPLISWILESGFSREGKLVAIGGGTIQDTTAFVASILHRGVPWVFYPTTLLAQCDSCIGSKTSINFGSHKNQLGTFYPPEEIVVDTTFLTTLSSTELRSGLGELLHYLVISGWPDFSLAEDLLRFPRLPDSDDLERLIRRSLLIKQGYIEVDEFDRRERRILNYGHSFAHAIESATSNRIPHGIAVAHGMDIANTLSVAQGLMSSQIRDRLHTTLARLTDSRELRGLTAQSLFLALEKDKKRVGSNLVFILAAEPGCMKQVSVALDSHLLLFLESYLSLVR